MQTITLSQADFQQLRTTLPELRFNPMQDAVVTDSLMLRHLHDYQFPQTGYPDVDFRVGGIEIGGFSVCCYYWLPKEAKGTTFLVHGYFDHVGLYGHLIQHLLAMGQAVVAFDLPGHGLSSGGRLAIDCFGQYQQALQTVIANCDEFPKPFNAVGQSTGGGVLLRLLQSREPLSAPLKNITLLAPLIKPWLWWLNIWLFRLLSPFVKNNPRNFRRNTSDREFAKFLKYGEPLQHRKIPLVWVAAMKQWIEDCDIWPECEAAIKVVQGNRDTTVEWKYNLAQIERKFPNAEIVVVQNAMHHMVNESPEMRAKIFKHIQYE